MNKEIPDLDEKLLTSLTEEIYNILAPVLDDETINPIAEILSVLLSIAVNIAIDTDTEKEELLSFVNDIYNEAVRLNTEDEKEVLEYLSSINTQDLIKKLN